MLDQIQMDYWFHGEAEYAEAKRKKNHKHTIFAGIGVFAESIKDK